MAGSLFVGFKKDRETADTLRDAYREIVECAKAVKNSKQLNTEIDSE